MTQTFEELEKAFGFGYVSEMCEEVETMEIKWSSGFDTEGALRQN